MHGVQLYGGKLFSKIRDFADDIFCKMEPPQPSVQHSNSYRGYNCRNMNSSSLAVLSQSSGPCFTGECIVTLANNGRKLVSEMEKGDYVKTNEDLHVFYVTKTHCHNNQTILAVNLENGLRITPYHPIKHNNE